MATNKKKQKSRLVEFIMAYEDRTWDTTIERVPFDPTQVEEQDTVSVLTEYAYSALSNEPRHQHVVYWGVMNEHITE